MSAIVETVQRWNFVDTVVKSNDETKDNSNVTIGFVFDDSVNDDAVYAQKLAGKMSGQAISVASVKDGNKFDVLYVPYKENIDLLNIFQSLQIVTSNSNTSIGGGGNPIQPYAPNIC